MKPRIKLDSARSPEGTLLELYEHDGQHMIIAGGQPLMTSRKHHSEEELARVALVQLPPRPKVLIGGLGMGFTLRTTLDLLPPDGCALQVELLSEIVDWNRGPLGAHAGHPLRDERVEVVIEDVVEVVRRHEGELAAILLDVDNGSTPVVEARNARLYSRRGLSSLRRALLPGGRLGIWAADMEPAFIDRLNANGFEAHEHITYARPGNKGGRHSIFLARKPLEPRC